MDSRAGKLLCNVPIEDIVDLAERVAEHSLPKLCPKDKALLARIGACPFSTELYLEAKAKAAGKRVVYVDSGNALIDAPAE